MAIDSRTPILVGVGQCVDHWHGGDATVAPDPASLRLKAALAALDDCGVGEAVARAIDRVVVVRTMIDSVAGTPHPFGRCANPPATLARSLGILSGAMIYSGVGGDQPQALVNETAEAIFAGEAEAVLIAGAEATGAMKLAMKGQITLNWSASVSAEMIDRGVGSEYLSAYERSNGLGPPTQTYPAFEHALRARLGLSRKAHLALMSELWSAFSRIAATNPFAQFAQARSAEYLATQSRDNYPVADPYLKWHVAQDAVNQGAAVVLTSVARATELGIDPAKWVYLHGYSFLADRPVMKRGDLSRSKAIDGALETALHAAGKNTADIAHFDLYSCFPCAVLLAAEALKLDWRQTPATVTGGLPFFGGPGNNYSMHAVATMVERLRSRPGEFGLVLANGGFLTNEAVGIYSTTPKAEWAPVSSAQVQQEIDDAPAPPCLTQSTEAVIETYTVTSKRGQRSRGYVIAEALEGRILARARTGDDAMLAALQAGDPVGQRVRITHEQGVNLIDQLDTARGVAADAKERRQDWTVS